MGWTGTGLGKNEQGRRDPVPFEMKDDNMGLGRWQMELEQAQDATEKRKQLEIEKEITPDLIEKYKAHVEKEQRIADATADLRRTYYCEPCDKQYRTYSEFDNHLNSYDHHHRQRLKDLYQQELSRKFGGQRNVQEEKEKKQAAKQIAIEREKMLARRAKGGANPGFKPIGQKAETTGASNPTSDDNPITRNTDEEMARASEKRARMAKYGLKFESAGMLNSVSGKASSGPPPKTSMAHRSQQCVDMFAEVDSGAVGLVRNEASSVKEDDDSEDGDDSDDGDNAASHSSEETDPRTTRPSFSMQFPATAIAPIRTQPAPHFLSTLSRPSPVPAAAPPPPLPVPSQQTTGPPPLVRKGYHAAQSFKTESSDEEGDEGLIRARIPVSKELKIKFSIKK